jgi:tRNA(Ile)-lysidine synthase
MRVMSAKGKLDIPNNTYTKWFDYDKIDWSKLCLRHRQAGDYLVINSKGSRKSLQDYMVDEKIERSKRDSVLLLADGDHILWVIGYRISEYYKISEESTRILEVEITEQ